MGPTRRQDLGDRSRRTRVAPALLTALAIAAAAACSEQSSKVATQTESSAATITEAPSTPDSTTTQSSPVSDPAAVTVPVEPTEPPPVDGLKPWTVMLYSIGDTDLEPFMMADVNEFGSVGTNENVNLVALVDRSADYSSDPVLDLGDWVGVKVIEVGVASGTVLGESEAVNTGDPEVLSEFIQSTIAAYPAEQYALVISDHGASWPGVGGDESAAFDSLTLPELRGALSGALQATGVERLDLLGFDACLMATYEVASALAPVARRMVASQELEPGHGWDYRSFGVVADEAGVDVDTLANSILDGYRDQAKAEGTDADITLSLIDLEQIAPLDSAVATFASTIAERAADISPRLGRVRESSLAYGRSPDSDEDAQMVDLGDLVSRIGIEALDISDEADQVIRALNDSVLRTVEGAASIKSTGLSVYFPPTEASFDRGYDAVVGDSPWLGLLNAFYGAGAAIPVADEPSFDDATSGPTGSADTQVTAEGVTITAQLDPSSLGNIVSTVVSYGVIEADGSITFLGEESAAFADDGSGTVTGTYDFTTFTMSDGQDTFTGYLWLDFDDEAGVVTIDVPMAYYAPDDIGGETYQDALLSITLNADTFDIMQQTYYAYDETLGSYGELFAEPEGIIVPEVFVLSADGVGSWEPTSDIGLFADLESLVYSFEPLPSGTQLYVDIAATDFGGNSALASGEVTVP